ncbi:hypothetical protein CWB96_07890 [Pseudoalteromonas citrea]|uniref:Uncharacterized protein n=2 Tax=Pseudoalteromonas citrea TaxID=43655 RepID=A0A5S3XTP1_9GAMM|nr:MULTISPECIES: hypothetical protein [Pseudoalteromonas]KAF7764222.1 hypothetical protein PCIT_b0159 [Pseudoalteromonas citrea]RJE76032.1 hypothetical protein BGP78_15065 [Pseudoalteromonas sp. MSK9-3]TMP38809.1 hypothetical protein CWB97_21515 [Pseudoalteromonas citrea]TMP60125.1 hypothetical protein CWB96_07890 [Pseudoalteromonas citrea]
MLLDAIFVNFIIISFCLAVTCIIMAITKKAPSSEERMQIKIEYGLFACAGIISGSLATYGYLA